jgi:hypothetical protein
VLKNGAAACVRKFAIKNFITPPKKYPTEQSGQFSKLLTLEQTVYAKALILKNSTKIFLENSKF